MRRVERLALLDELAAGLVRLQYEADADSAQDGFDATAHWNRKRKTTTIVAVYTILRQMAGLRERCMYCVDSLASDIEHFWPKVSHHDRMYQWGNLLAACTPCGRRKGNKFPIDDSGAPLLIDPTAEDPWDFLDFDPQTGNITARFVVSDGFFSAKGTKTVEILHLDRREALSLGYRKTCRRLLGLLEKWVEGDIPDDYVAQLREADDHGLLGWFFHGAGADEPPLRRFRAKYQEAWAACERSFS